MAIPATSEVHTAVACALKSLYTDDAQLFHFDAGERTLVGHFARYLSENVRTWGSEWSIDVEYNRMLTPEHDEVTYKYLLDVRGASRRPAYPDLIVHQRGVDGWHGGNLLVVEAKKSPTRIDQREDHAKLVAWMRELQYRYGLRLELGPRSAKGSWIDASSDPTAPLSAIPLW
ncbi:MAG: hypothetical protein ACJ74O_17955 [Frankiaceae bacterium]